MGRNDLLDSGLLIGVVGAGAMGSGISQVAAAAGRKVLIYDQREGAVEAARDGILARMDKRVREGRLPAAEREAMASRLCPVATLEELAPCGLVVEAIVEELDAKRGLFTGLEGIVSADAVLASNTSSIPIGAIAAGLNRPDRVAGLHFFNPVPLMKLVEVIPAPDTAAEVIEGLMALSRVMEREPVRARDTPGFLVNFGGRPFVTEGLTIAQEGVASPAQIDAVMRDCWGFRMGPFELMDLTGMDVNLPVTEFIHHATFSDPRMRSTYLHRYKVATGQLGRKTGRGHYDYHDGAERPSPDAETRRSAAPAVAIAEPSDALLALLKEMGIEVLETDDGAVPLLAAPIGEDCSTLCSRIGADHRRLIGVDVTGDTTQRVTLMVPPGGDPAIRESVVARFNVARNVTLVGDSPGFIGQRICAMVANLGCEMAQLELANPGAIDAAMRLGLNYPRGPLELADAIGVERLHEIMRRIQEQTGDDRYRPSQWLRRRAQLGLSARAPAFPDLEDDA